MRMHFSIVHSSSTTTQFAEAMLCGPDEFQEPIKHDEMYSTALWGCILA